MGNNNMIPGETIAEWYRRRTHEERGGGRKRQAALRLAVRRAASGEFIWPIDRRTDRAKNRHP